MVRPFRFASAGVLLVSSRLPEGTATQESPFANDKYFLGALAQHPGASPALLNAIARLEDPALSQRMWSLWDVMGENRSGASVKDLVERHPNRRN